MVGTFWESILVGFVRADPLQLPQHNTTSQRKVCFGKTLSRSSGEKSGGGATCSHKPLRITVTTSCCGKAEYEQQSISTRAFFGTAPETSPSTSNTFPKLGRAAAPNHKKTFSANVRCVETCCGGPKGNKFRQIQLPESSYHFVILNTKYRILGTFSNDRPLKIFPNLF